MENHFECLRSLFRSILSLEIEGASGFALVTLAAVHWFHECWPGDHAACSRHHPGIAGAAGPQAGKPAQALAATGPGYAVEPASLGAARRGAGRP